MSDSCFLKNLGFICMNESVLEIMKNAFYFNLKALFVFKVQYLNFCPDLFGCVGKWLAKKAKLISKFMTLPTGKQIITIQILL